MKEKLYIGLDLGGTTLKYGIVNEKGELLVNDEAESNADQGKDVILNVIKNSIELLIKEAENRNGEVVAVGLGTPGNVNIETGELMNISPAFRKWGKLNIKTVLEEKINLPVFLDNDANLAALGEFYYELEGKPENLIYVTIGTGIGGGIIINGELFRGAAYSGAEIGHFSIIHNGEKCNCNGLGCWERYASTSAMLKFYNSETENKVPNAIEFFKRVKDNEKLALRTLDNEYYYLAVGISSLLNIFNSDMVAIGGGISGNPLFDIDKVKKYIDERAMENCSKNLILTKATLANKAGILGAAAFAKQMVIKKE